MPLARWTRATLAALGVVLVVGGLAAQPAAAATPAPTISTIVPPVGAAGTAVTITGTNFDTSGGTNDFSFGSVAVPSNEVSCVAVTGGSSGEDACTMAAPPQSSPTGTVDVTVVVDGQSSGVFESATFTYTTASSLNGVEEGYPDQTDDGYIGDLNGSTSCTLGHSSCGIGTRGALCPGQSSIFGSDQCSTLDLPSNIVNSPDGPVGNTPCGQVTWAACPLDPTSPALGTYLFVASPNNPTIVNDPNCDFNNPPSYCASDGLAPGDTVTISAPGGTVFPTVAADFALAPVCNYVFAPGTTPNAWICNSFGSEGAETPSSGGVSTNASGNAVTITLPDGWGVPQGQSFGIFIAAVANPPEGQYSQGSYLLSTSESGGQSSVDDNGSLESCQQSSTELLCFVSGSAYQPFASVSSSPSAPAAVSTDNPNGVAVTATVLDQYGNPVVGDNVFIAPSSGSNASLAPGFTPPSNGTNSGGSITEEFVDTKPEGVIFTAVDGTEGFTIAQPAGVNTISGAGASADFIAGTPSGGSRLSEACAGPITGNLSYPCATTASVPANGTPVLVTVPLADQFGNPDVTANATCASAGSTCTYPTGDMDNPSVGDPIVLTPISGTGEPQGDRVFGAGSITPLDVAGGNEKVLCAGEAAPAGEGCTELTNQYGTTSSGAPMAIAQFEVSDIVAEDVTFGIDDLSTIGYTGGTFQGSPFTVTIDFDATVPTTGPGGKSTVSPATQTVVASPGGATTGTITVSLKDADNNPVPGLAVALASSSSTSTPAAAEIPDTTSNCPTQAPAGTADCNGQVAFKVGDSAQEDVTYTASWSGTLSPGGTPTSGTLSQTATVDFIAGPASSNSSVTASPPSTLVGSSGTSTITVLLKDANGLPATGRCVTLSQGPGHSLITPVANGVTSACTLASEAGGATTDANGRAQFAVTDTTVETVTYTATDDSDSEPLTQTASVGFTNPPSTAKTTIIAAPSSVLANGSATSTITVTLEDQNGVRLSGKNLCLTQSATAVAAENCPTGLPPSTATAEAIPDATSTCPSQAAAGTTDCNGEAEFVVSSGTAETVTYGVVDLTDFPNGSAIGPIAQVTFEPVPSEAGESTMSASPSEVFAGASGPSGTSTVTVQLLDASKNPIAGDAVTLHSSSTTSTIQSVEIPDSTSGCTTQEPAGTSDCNGDVAFDVTDSAAEQVKYTAEDTTTSVTLNAQTTVTYLPDEGQASYLAVASATALANGGATAAGIDDVTVFLDPGSNPLVGDHVVLSATAGSSNIEPVEIPDSTSGCSTQAPAGTSDCKGEVEFQVSDQTVEDVTYTAFDDATATTIATTQGGQPATVDFLPAAPVVDSISPNSGPIGGGTSVTITGTSLYVEGKTPSISFGATPAISVSCTSSTSCVVVSPSVASAGTVEIVVTTVAGPSTPASPGADQFTYRNAAPAVTSISPTRGPTSGGTVVTVNGSNLGATGSTTVSFGSTTLPATSVNAAGTQLTVTSPSELAGTVNVTVTFGGQTSSTVPADDFTYTSGGTPGPVVNNVSPSSGSAGTTVILSGSGFSPTPGATVVDFGTAAATGVSCTSTTQCTAKAPSGVGTVYVTVTVNHETSTPSGTADQFTYMGGASAPTITAVTPSSGPVGTKVTITGTGFSTAAGKTIVSFGTVHALGVTCSSSTTCTATAPNGTGTVKVVVVVNSQTSSDSGTFTYTIPPTVTRVTPNVAAAGKTITIVGTGFSLTPGATVVYFGTTAATNVVCTSSTSCTVTVPPGSGSVNVTVLVDGLTSAVVATDRFTYIA